jgi:hypothetical protein
MTDMQHFKFVEEYRGFRIYHNHCAPKGYCETNYYTIEGSDIALATIKAARNVIDTHLKQKR